MQYYTLSGRSDCFFKISLMDLLDDGVFCIELCGRFDLSLDDDDGDFFILSDNALLLSSSSVHEPNSSVAEFPNLFCAILCIFSRSVNTADDDNDLDCRIAFFISEISDNILKTSGWSDPFDDTLNCNAFS